MSRLRARLLAAVNKDDIAEVASALLERTKGGDIAAARFVAEYTIGRPSAMPGDGDPHGGRRLVINIVRED